MESLLATEHEFDLFLLLLALALEEAPAAAKDTFWDWRCEKSKNIHFLKNCTSHIITKLLWAGDRFGAY